MGLVRHINLSQYGVIIIPSVSFERDITSNSGAGGARFVFLVVEISRRRNF